MSEEIVFASLADVPLREAWNHEAHRFTPWLADNLDRLSAAIGVPLELTGTEMRVGAFSADILARSIADGSVVLIENQLEGSDHTHLGQIMTYLAGLETHTMIWVAPYFRDEHLSAVRWLNEHTVDPFAFFAVRLRVVRIADSPYAPLFEVIERPNNWDRRVADRKREVEGVSPQVERRRAFWARYNELYPASAADVIGGGGSSRWRRFLNDRLVVSQWLSQDTAGVFLRGGRGQGGEVITPILFPYQQALEVELGTPLGSAAYPFEKRGPVDVSDPARWDEAIHWLEDETSRYVAVVTRMLETQS
jgi:hypothetical protein